jgi:hypothetical protein
MSPYRTSLTRIASKLCGSDQRKRILRGFLAYRQALCDIGLQSGIQWLSGSFMEDIEGLETRHPNDVDVVTFCHRPSALENDDAGWQEFVRANEVLIDPPQVKAAYACDAYFVDLNVEPCAVVSSTRYWFGLFSHRRDGLWKGLLEIPLSVTQDDADASQLVRP